MASPGTSTTALPDRPDLRGVVDLGVGGPPTKLHCVPGLFGGAMFAVYIWALDEPPEHVRHHREGVEGKQATERVLRSLAREGWHAVHNAMR